MGSGSMSARESRRARCGRRVERSEWEQTVATGVWTMIRTTRYGYED